jgi:hypothetical protein
VSVRYAALGALAILVLVLGVYLFLEVRSTPAAAHAPIESGDAGSSRTSQATPPSHVDAVGSRDALAIGTAGADGSVAPLSDRFKRRAGKPGGELARDPEVVPVPSTDDPTKPPKDKEFDQKLDAVMSEANKAYDRGDFDDAKVFAQKVLAKTPGNVRMLRILVSASCIDGDSTEAQKRYLELPPPDRAQMRTRCDRYGVTFTEK